MVQKKPQFWNFWGPFFRKNIISRGKNSWKTRFWRQKNFLTHKSPLKWQTTGFLTPICFRKRWPSKVSKFRFFCTTLYILPSYASFFTFFHILYSKSNCLEIQKNWTFFSKIGFFPHRWTPPLRFSDFEFYDFPNL